MSAISDLTHQALRVLETELSDFIRDNIGTDAHEEEDPDEQEDTRGDGPRESYATRQQKQFTRILGQLCDLIRDYHEPDKNRLIETIDGLITNAITANYNADEFRNVFPDDFDSFAHTEDNYVKSTDNPLSIGAGAQKELMALLRRAYGGTASNGQPIEDIFAEKFGSQSYQETIGKPHPSTTALSRFNAEFKAPWSCPYPDPLAQAVYEARCEIHGESLVMPIKLHLSSDNGCLSFLGAGGWKDRDPLLFTYDLTSPDTKFSQDCIKAGLSSIAFNIASDAQRKLVFIADDERIKSYNWQTTKATHTLDSGNFGGPLAVVANDIILRAGTGSVGAWKIDTLPTHGANGRGIIGNEMDLEDTSSWRDEPEENIEPSTGSAASTTIDLDPTLATWDIKAWGAHPSAASTMLVAAQGQCAVAAVDMEHGGKVGTKFIGHAELPFRFSTNPEAAPNQFVTGCEDGHIRLWDVRQALPVLTLAAGERSNPSVAFAHPGGVPMIFGGCEKAEVIKMWDVRAPKMVYELAAGNNQVRDIAWDQSRSVLYAATECLWMDRMGNRYDYRRLSLPKWQRAGSPTGASDEENEEDYEDIEDDEDYDDGRAWPKKAFHDEEYFGDVYDSGDHALLRFSFKQDANPDITPAYGDAVVGEGGAFGW
ncbi:hypothetical protein CYLTODRAFT_364902 [Cylindrobasidium torrendii FP15055 ss-10]|uniref:Uncharacterized protein n=1 Tax=Cylindrobasidium torrendii FP15055 ss-10 TaxID=1314674 RepID=A0A0D7BUQ7_9AGAR|nr:hypothetical protein CYLTODRAFT_364902 [Cylindrobasidium torrendii FP15055 ss-10]